VKEKKGEEKNYIARRKYATTYEIKICCAVFCVCAKRLAEGGDFLTEDLVAAVLQPEDLF